MTEDILEQLVEGYFSRNQSTFTKTNVKFRPSEEDLSSMQKEDVKKYSVHSDIDVIAVQLNEAGEKTVSVVSCKSWQEGFDLDRFYTQLPHDELRNQRYGSGPIWKKFRELVDEKWAKAFREKIIKETGTGNFTYFIAVTKFMKGRTRNIEEFIKHPLFLKNLSGDGTNSVKIAFLTLEEMLGVLLKENSSTTPESSEIGRFIQLIRAAGLHLKKA